MSLHAPFNKGVPVMTAMGKGVIVYARMAAPNYSEAEAYSVKLDSRKDDPFYIGTIFVAAAVTLHHEEG